MQSKRLRRTVGLCLAMLVAFWLALGNFEHPVLRLEWPKANVVVLWVLLLLPWIAAIVALARLRGLARWIIALGALWAIVVGFVPLVAVTIGVTSLGSEYPDTGDVSISRTDLPRGGALAVYDVDCGALCAPEFEVRHERAILPGLRLVRVVYRGPDEAPDIRILTPTLALVGRDTVQVSRWVYP